MAGRNTADRVIMIFFGAAIALMALIWLGIAALDIFMQNSSFCMGIAGYARQVTWRVLLSLVALFVLLKLFKTVRRTDKWQAIAACCAGMSLCVIVPALFWQGVIQDVPYLENPVITYLSGIEFENDTLGDDAPDYSLTGTDIEGEEHRFDLSMALFDQGRELWQENHSLHAKVAYLPHTGVAMSVEFLSVMDKQIYDLYPASADLPDDWRSMAIQINDTVYTLPLPLSEFLDDGWELEDQDKAVRLEGADELYEEYSHESVDLVNEAGQEITVNVYNTTERAIPLADGTVGGIYIIYGNLDFSGTDLRLPGGLMLGWSTKSDVVSLYGEPSENILDRKYRYRDEQCQTSYLTLDFDTDTGYLDSIMIHNLPYWREE